MAYVSTEIKNLVLAMTSNPAFFSQNIVSIYSEAELQAIYKDIKFELSAQIMDEDDADMLYLLQLTLQNSCKFNN